PFLLFLPYATALLVATPMTLSSSCLYSTNKVIAGRFCRCFYLYFCGLVAEVSKQRNDFMEYFHFLLDIHDCVIWVTNSTPRHSTYQ
ncbi:hypothetical protein, partial [Yersinia aleksiciae]|uniref:hypothetical protein n=1 Tax=Yersinia aleksiciae TaxID=263819 RepID=UPI001C1297E0